MLFWYSQWLIKKFDSFNSFRNFMYRANVLSGWSHIRHKICFLFLCPAWLIFIFLIYNSKYNLDVFITKQGLANVHGLLPIECSQVIIEKCAHPDRILELCRKTVFTDCNSTWTTKLNWKNWDYRLIFAIARSPNARRSKNIKTSQRPLQRWTASIWRLQRWTVPIRWL